MTSSIQPRTCQYCERVSLTPEAHYGHEENCPENPDRPSNDAWGWHADVHGRYRTPPRVGIREGVHLPDDDGGGES